VDIDVAEEFFACIVSVDGLQEHGAFVLVEPLCRVIDVIVCACIWAADNLLVSVWRSMNHSCSFSYHDCDVIVVNAVVVNWRL